MPRRKTSPENERRQERAANAISEYVGDCGEDTALTDLLTDLRHWADRERVDFARAVALSQDHHKAELAE